MTADSELYAIRDLHVDLSDNVRLARDAICSARPGVGNTVLTVTLSDDLLMTMANAVQQMTIFAALRGDPTAHNWHFLDYQAECLRTLIADARSESSRERYGRHAPACFAPPADYECKPEPATDSKIDNASLASLRKRYADAIGRYDIDEHSLVTCHGKFEREHISTVVYWDMLGDGSATETWFHDGFGYWAHMPADATDCAMWPDLAMNPGDIIELHESDSGFVTMDVIPMGKASAREHELDVLCYGSDE